MVLKRFSIEIYVLILYINYMLLNGSIFECFKESNPNLENVKLEYYGKKFTVKETIESILKVGSFLLENQASTSVGIMLPNIPEAIFTLYACSATGKIANLINPKIPTLHLKKVLEKTNTNILFLYDALYAKHKEMLSELNVKVVLCSPFYYRTSLKIVYELTSVVNKGKYFEQALKCPPCTPLSFDGTDTVAYIHSGGTTGEPKTVVLSSFALNSLGNAIATTVHPNADYDEQKDAMLMMLPIFHGFGLGVCVHTIACLFRIILEPRFVPSESVRLIKKHKVTHLAGVPAMYRKMLEVSALYDGRLRFVTDAFCGGDSLSPVIKEQFDLALKNAGSQAELAEGYGLSETASVVTVGRKGSMLPLSQGQALKGNVVKIFNGTSFALPNEFGEIYVSTPSLMSGYLGEESAQNLTEIDGRLYLKTGDLGFMDDQGNLFYKERIKRSIKIGAINVFPQEIERVVNAVDGVKECCAARVYDKNKKPYIRLHLVMQEGRTFNSQFEGKIKKRIEQEIVRYATPRQFRLEKEIKRTTMGKVDFTYYEQKRD